MALTDDELDDAAYGYRRGDPAPSFPAEKCIENSCALWAAGAAHKCEIGKCEKFWRKYRAWERAQAAEQEPQDIFERYGGDAYDYDALIRRAEREGLDTLDPQERAFIKTFEARMDSDRNMEYFEDVIEPRETQITEAEEDAASED